MNSPGTSYDLNDLIQRLKLVRNQEVIRQFHALLDLFEKGKISPKATPQMTYKEYIAKIDAAEKSIREGTTLPQEEFQKEVKEWLSRKTK